MGIRLVALVLVVSAGAMAPTPAHAEFTEVVGVETGVEFSASDSGFEVSAVATARDKLKGSTKTQGDFNLANRFSFEIDGVLVAGVHSVDGLESESDIVEYKDGEDGTIHTRPGNHKPGKMTMTKDWSNTSEFLKWRKAVLDGKVDRRSISVIFHNDAGEEAGRIEATGCIPTQVLVTDPSLGSDKAPRQEVVGLECLTMIAKSKHDAAMAAIQNTR